jgi:UDP-glucose:(heptosyl)LPS alpha-1,3-glucosyltransferase
MRLAIIRQRYSPGGAIESRLEAALAALLERNVAISLYTRSWDEPRLQLIETIICNPGYLGSLWREWSFARSVGRAIGSAKVDLVEAHDRVPCCDVYRAWDGVYASWLSQRYRDASAFARLRQRWSPTHQYMLRAERRVFASPWLQAVICPSKMVRDEIRDRFGVPESKLHVIYNSVDTQILHPGLRAERAKVLEHHNIGADATIFLLACTGYEHSGAGAAIEALAELPPPAHLIIAGRERHAERYRTLAREIGVADRITVADTGLDLRAYYGAADVFVLPTLYDPAPDSTLEAMACGLPVVTSTKSGAAELLLEHDAGLVCPAGDVAGLAAQMRSLLTPETRERQGANARKAALPLSPAAITLQLVLLYRDLLAATVTARAQRKSVRKGPDNAPTAPRSTPAAERDVDTGKESARAEALIPDSAPETAPATASPADATTAPGPTASTAAPSLAASTAARSPTDAANAPGPAGDEKR